MVYFASFSLFCLFLLLLPLMANKVVCDAYLNERSVIFSEEIPRWLVGEKG